ncbi:MAG: NifB/NifX family molybdenum-iron cluster-binding protein [Spirochaetales bacterium]|uniref:NifB/NifX family molybdenum-iron cluster-binding protein n=1 Tax=Candidatus Thalassospirochaeta sargassi TaxID=3119039 RepID=A0AAJ1ICK9_9SPIO|nr:NifB/NifX family molybdenum-iron cluster-binding protein [Spirochaetales bacterium]
MKIITALATDDGITTNNRHFGDADYYFIYEITEDGYHFIKKIGNSTDVEGETHADPRKAKNVTEMLSAEKVNTAVARVFGPNLKRIKSKFVCILAKDDEITEILQKLILNRDSVETEWEKGTDRSFLRI